MIHGKLPIQSELQDPHFARLSGEWSALGVWCSLWSPDGEPRGAPAKAPAFWGTLWNHDHGFREELARAVRRGAGGGHRGQLLDVPGLSIIVHPAGEDAAPAVVLVCAVGPSFDAGEAFARLCSRWQLDHAALARSARQVAPLSPQRLEPVMALVLDSLEQSARNGRRQVEVDQMSLQLADAYEELSLIYRIGASMQVTHEPRAHYGQLFAELVRTAPFSALAAVLNDTDVLDPENRMILGGDPIVDEPRVLKLLCSLPGGGDSTAPAVLNSLDHVPQLQWAASWLKRLIVVPIVCNRSRLGTVLVLNERRDRDFDSNALKLLQAVVDRSAAYLENYLLYGDLNKLLMGLMHALVASIDAKDPYTCGHSNRVAFICKRLALKSGAEPQQAERLYVCGLLHDIGKIGIPESVLCKLGRLAPEEIAQMQRHPEIGARILGGIKQLQDVIPAVLHHHEKPDGSGYPAGLAGGQIPWPALVVGLADSFDAMTTGRTYRGALPLAAALAEVRRWAGTQFCPRLVDALIELIAEGLAGDLRHVKTDVSFERWRR